MSKLIHRSVEPAAGRWAKLAVVAALAGLAGAVSLPVSAQSGEVPQFAGEREDVADPPGRAGRLAEVIGSVWLFHPEAGEWIAAQPNRPLTTGDRLATDPGGRVELRIGSTSLRLDGGSELEVVRLDDDNLALELYSGSLAARVRSNEALREFSLSTSDGRFTVQRTGRYRFDRRDNLSQVTVWSGQALYEGPQSALTVNNGQRADFWIDGNQRAQYNLGEPVNDSFAGWVAQMDGNDDRAVASRYVSPEMTGAEDLDRYGRWEQDPEYGALWTPRDVPVDWAPYAVGQWAWVSPWGWTWVDAAPWGFAPFHYGRWVSVRNRWCWAPGRYVARPVYAPALVGWVGGGRGNVSVSIGGGPGVGWFPLAPREAYVPGFRVSPRYVRTVNGPHYRNGADIELLIRNPGAVLRDTAYRNRSFPRGTTAAPIDAFQRRGPIVVSPQWRGNAAVAGFDRLPANPVGVVAPPTWLRAREAGRDPGRPPGRDFGRDDRREPPREVRGDARGDGRGDGRVEGRRDGRPETGSQFRGRIEAGPLPQSESVPVRPAMPFVNNDGPQQRPDERGRSRQPFPDQRATVPAPQVPPPIQPPQAVQPQRPTLPQPPVAAAVQPQPPARVDAPVGQRPFNSNRPDRPDMPQQQQFERPDRPSRGFDRPDRPDRGERVAPAVPQPQPQPQLQPEAPRMAPPSRAIPVAPPPQVLPQQPPPAQVAPPARGPQPQPQPAVQPPARTEPIRPQPEREQRDGGRDQRLPSTVGRPPL